MTKDFRGRYSWRRIAVQVILTIANVVAQWLRSQTAAHEVKKNWINGEVRSGLV